MEKDKNILRIKSLYVSFTKEYYTLNDINLEINCGDKLVIVGDKDSGRTAFLRTIVGLEPIAKGEVLYKNISISKINFKEDLSLGYVPAVPVLLKRKSVKQNVEYVLKLRNNDKNFISATVKNSLTEFGLGFIEEKKVKDLNYFDKLKLSIARLSTRPLDILLIDDIFTKLSSMEKEKIVKFIKTLVKNQGCAVIVMTDSDEVANMFGYSKKYMIYGSLKDTKEEPLVD